MKNDEKKTRNRKMLSNISRWTPELTEENENSIQVSTDDYSTCSNFEQTDSSSSSSDSIVSEMDGRRIYCSGRDLHTISADVFSYPDISYLELSPTREASLDFKLGELPRAIGRLTELRFLILDSNDLRTLPNELCNLRELLVLVVANNSLTNLPDAIGNMQQLESIHATNNHIRDLPASFFTLKNLTFLDLSSNKLRQLSDGIGQLTQLRSLLLYDNRLRSIPDSINMLKQLTTLWLGRNRLHALPRNLTQLKQLDWKHKYLSTILDGNPLLSPPLSICVLGFTAINKWYQQNSSIGNLNLEGVQQCNDGQSSVGGGSTARLPIERSPHFFN